ncbi:MAG: indolepyruvate ferredoxin oxidoreductase subunit alpha [Candidatus Aenigmatarchaeota archaeon]
MAWSVDNRKCMRCGGCVGVCPFNTLDLKENGLENDLERCTLCGICQKFCPVAAIKVVK